MKLVTAIIKPDKVEALRQALTGVDIQGLTIVEAKGYGRQKGHTELYRGAEYEVHFLPKSRAEVLVDSADGCLGFRSQSRNSNGCTKFTTRI